jgi:aminopeptidase N
LNHLPSIDRRLTETAYNAAAPDENPALDTSAATTRLDKMRSRLLLLLHLICFTFPLTLNAEKPFDFSSTPGKLPKQVVPQKYSIRIKPDLAKLTFSGSEAVKIDVREPVQKLVLNALELKVTSAAIDGKPIATSALKLDPKEETLTISLPEELPAAAHTLTLTFAGKINQQGQGLYYARYQEEGSGHQKIMLGTQFEATDARRMFPCWDEPSFRARFQLTAEVPENFLAVSNMPVESENKTTDGKEVHFAMTPSMSSYLNVFVAGELELIESKVGDTQIRVITTKNKAQWGRYALEASAQILQYYNEYFAVPYPLPKLDQIAVPGGFGGAMENWGGITYYESALLFDPQKSSTATKQGIYQVLAHEMAHMWFGDLVTMAWWDNLWLNEGFASWMGSKCSARFNPQWEVWLEKNVPRDPTRRRGIAKERAMEGDALSTTHPIQQKISTEAEANSAFDDITYLKGQSFLRMLENFLGEEPFRDGIRKYIAKHKDSNTTTADLWNSLAEATGKPVGEIAAGWTEQPGFPVVKVARKDPATLALGQERFTMQMPNTPDLQWKIPLTYSLGQKSPVSLLMENKTAEITNAPADQVLKFNVEGAGYYRVQYDPGSWNMLLNQFPKLSASDRVNLLCDSWSFVQANRAPVSLYFEAIEKLPPTADLAEHEQVINAFDFVDRLILGTLVRASFQIYARSNLRPKFDQLGWDPRSNESPRSALLRADLIDALGHFGDQEIAAGCKERFRRYLTDPTSISPDLRSSILKVVGRYADEPTWNKLHELGVKTSSIEEKENYYDALAQTTDPKLISRTLQIALTQELPTSRAVYLVARVARCSEHPELAWQFAKAHMKELLAKTDALGANRYAPSLFVFFSDRARIDEIKAYAKNNLPSGSATDKAVAQAVDEIGFRAELKERLTPQLMAWVKKSDSGSPAPSPIKPAAPGR